VQDSLGEVRDVDIDTTGDAFIYGILYGIASDPSIFKVIQIS